MDNKHSMFALFNNFEEVREAIIELKVMDLREGGVEEMMMKSPIPHPELEEVIGARPVYVQRFTFVGALLGLLGGFLLTAALSQSMFSIQPQGGKPIIPIPMNLVIMYEGTILFGVLFTVAGFLIGARLLHRTNPLYSSKVSEDQVGLLLEVKASHYEKVKELLWKHKAQEIIEDEN
jgi:Alternative complex III, ActD subunit